MIENELTYISNCRREAYHVCSLYTTYLSKCSLSYLMLCMQNAFRNIADHNQLNGWHYHHPIIMMYSHLIATRCGLDGAKDVDMVAHAFVLCKRIAGGDIDAY